MPFKDTPLEILDDATGELTMNVPDERSVMVSGLVPLSVDIGGKPIYINKDANSALAFRPTLFGLIKENKETVQVESSIIKAAIKEIQEKLHRNEKHGIGVSYKFLYTMVDSGFVNKDTGNHDAKCRVCHYTMPQYRYGIIITIVNTSIKIFAIIFFFINMISKLLNY